MDTRAVPLAGQSPTACVTREDCAAASAAAHTQDGHPFHAYDISGPEATGAREIATLASNIAMAPITPVTPEAGGAGRGPGPGPSSVTVVSTAMADLTGRAPMNVEEFLEANWATLEAAASR